ASAARVEADLRKLVSFGTRHTLGATDDPKRGVGAARDWLKDELERISKEHHGGRLQVAHEAFQLGVSARVPTGIELINVVATLPGTDPDRIVVLSGHYDSIPSARDPSPTRDAPGANDDGSGTVAVLEAARLLGGLKPRATLVFLCVAGEEQGLLGSKAQAAAWKAAGKEVEAMFTMDIIGGAVGQSGLHEPWRLRVFSEGVPSGSGAAPVFGSDNDSSSRQLARYFERAAESAVPGLDVTLIFRQDRYLRFGDHKSFNDLGWPAVRLTEPHEHYAHQHQDVAVVDGQQYGDLPEYVDFAYVARVAAAVGAACGELALAPASPRAVQVDTRELTPNTRLQWAPPVEGDGVAGYAVLIRRTHEPVWTERRVLGRVSEVTLTALSKDDWLFAVEAIDESGNRSRAVYPTPRRR
ncbi:MAG: M20/M25/M40 family metallo-hydrolase, partial [Planctomycetota bacterium]|nr:M20/M25/M40 family metallo-hydrolase [Planctomycetota bacterium]